VAFAGGVVAACGAGTPAAARAGTAGTAPASAPNAPPAPRPAAPAAPAAPPPALRVLALGRLEMYRDGERLPDDAWRAARPRELLLYLLCHPQGRTREQIGLVFWPDASSTQTKNNFHVTLHHLRKSLGRSDLVAFDDEHYRVAWEAGVEFDALLFEREVKDALRASGDAAATDALKAALARYRGELLAEERVGDWHLEIRDRLARLFAEGTRALGQRLERAERHAEAAEAYRRLVAADPMDEEAHRRLMLALARTGERAQALRQYERLVVLLRAELEAEPEPETVSLHERLRRAEAV